MINFKSWILVTQLHQLQKLCKLQLW